MPFSLEEYAEYTTSHVNTINKEGRVVSDDVGELSDEALLKQVRTARDSCSRRLAALY